MPRYIGIELQEFYVYASGIFIAVRHCLLSL